MNKNSIIAKIKQKTKGIYSEKFYFDLADDILGVKKYQLPKFARKHDEWIDKLLIDVTEDEKLYSNTITRIFNEDHNTNLTPKRVFTIMAEYCKHLGYVYHKGKDIDGRYITITKYEPK